MHILVIRNMLRITIPTRDLQMRNLVSNELFNSLNILVYFTKLSALIRSAIKHFTVFKSLKKGSLQIPPAYNLARSIHA